jgi:hypothetical protein
MFDILWQSPRNNLHYDSNLASAAIFLSSFALVSIGTLSLSNFGGFQQTAKGRTWILASEVHQGMNTLEAVIRGFNTLQHTSGIVVIDMFSHVHNYNIMADIHDLALSDLSLEHSEPQIDNY